MYIEKIKLINKTFPGSKALKKGFEIKCSDINIFVGNQGCGKSTILKILQKSHPDLEITLSEHTKNNGVDSFYFDTEKDNPRVKDLQAFSNVDGSDKGIGYRGALMSHFQSHGEVLELFIIEPLLKAKNSIILLDEPESGLSITNQFRLIEAIKTAVENKCQIFIASHCYPLIEEFHVISLEHNKQMSGKEFINLIK